MVEKLRIALCAVLANVGVPLVVVEVECADTACRIGPLGQFARQIEWQHCLDQHMTGDRVADDCTLVWSPAAW